MPDHHLWSLLFPQMSGPVQWTGDRLFHVSHGNLVQFGVGPRGSQPAQREDESPLISAVAAKALLGAYIGGWQGTDQFSELGTLHYIPRGVNDTVGYTGPMARAGRRRSLPLHFHRREPDRELAGAW